MAYIKGSLKQIIYQTDKGFIVGLFKVVDTDEAINYLNRLITFTGIFHHLKQDIDYKLYGDLVEHPRYGEQFSVTAYERIMPETTTGIISFLSSKLFPGVGVKLATKIVDSLGDNTLDLINEDYHNLLLISSISEKKAIKIHNILKRENDSYKIIIQLQKLGFSINDASKIYQHYKESTINIIEDNVYTIINDIEGIGFLTVDQIAKKMGFVEDDDRRIKACIKHIINNLCIANGHIYNNFEDIYLGITNYIGFNLSTDNFNYYLLELNKAGQIVIEEDRYYLKDYYEAETYNANFILKLLVSNEEPKIDLDKHINNLEREYKLKYNDKQRLAIKSSFIENLLIITGGPGTGKTTIIKAIVGLYTKLNNLTTNQLDNELALLAPTGRAAKRITETTGIKAMTIHKFLKWNKETNSFGINEMTKADVKFVIVDEGSMLDNFLLANLLKGLPPNIKIIFVGDQNQLPSVGPGEILKDLIMSQHIPVIELDDLYRQQEDSYIISLAHDIKDGLINEGFDAKHDDYNFVEVDRLNIKNIIHDLCLKALKKGYSYKDIQVLIPMYKGINGIDNINTMLQAVFNPETKKNNQFIHNNITYRTGDKVLQTKNNNDLNISNGDIGTIEDIQYENSQYSIMIDFNDEIVEYKPKDFDDIKLGYAISIHKSQGSEFEIVILPIEASYRRMLYRKLIYTAVTRAKKSLMIIGSQEAFKYAVINERELTRKTSLKSRLDKITNV